MATRQVLAELLAAYEQQTGQQQPSRPWAAWTRPSGCRPARLSTWWCPLDAIDKLIAAGAVVAGGTDWVRSGVAVAVRAGAPLPGIGSEDAVRSAVLAARSISYSTGPSGVALAKLFERWGIADQVASRMVQAPPGGARGLPGGTWRCGARLPATGELLHVEGITIVGPLPPAIQITTIFSSGVAASSQQPEAAKALLDFFASPAAAKPSNARAWTLPEPEHQDPRSTTQ